MGNERGNGEGKTRIDGFTSQVEGEKKTAPNDYCSFNCYRLSFIYSTDSVRWKLLLQASLVIPTNVTRTHFLQDCFLNYDYVNI
mmetsp:Transcript_13298/g.19070  ORF Transcript_13298/g.19070 Transcript_13298/m.19070 type:complete len:84 (+) Transcript_13298:396-647(+)